MMTEDQLFKSYQRVSKGFQSVIDKELGRMEKAEPSDRAAIISQAMAQTMGIWLSMLPAHDGRTMAAALLIREAMQTAAEIDQTKTGKKQ